MEYRRLGSAGIKLSRFSIGAWVTYGGQVDEDGAVACLQAALDRGVNFIDNAEAYAHGEAEVVVGRAIRRLGVARKDVVLSSKVFWGGDGPNDVGLSRKHVFEACQGALRRLGVDYLDLYLCHRPDPDTPVAETALAMDILVRQGKVLYWGTSEWTAEQLDEAYEVCASNGFVAPQCEQPQYNLFHRARVEVELARHYTQHGLGTTVWSPLASGVLTGKYDGGAPAGSRLSLPQMAWLKDDLLAAERLAAVRRLRPIAADLGCTLAQLALAWCARSPTVSTVITGASRPEQVVENLGAEDVVDKLSPEVLQRIDAAIAGAADLTPGS